MGRPYSVLIDVWRDVALRRVKREKYVKNQRLDPVEKYHALVKPMMI